MILQLYIFRFEFSNDFISRFVKFYRKCGVEDGPTLRRGKRSTKQQKIAQRREARRERRKKRKQGILLDIFIKSVISSREHYSGFISRFCFLSVRIKIQLTINIQDFNGSLKKNNISKTQKKLWRNYNLVKSSERRTLHTHLGCC